MNKKRVSDGLKAALSAAEGFLCLDKSSGEMKIPKTFKGYVASFGPMAIECGIKATVARYLQSTESQGDRRKIGHAICDIAGVPQEERLHAILNASIEREKQYKRELMDASIALKLAMSTFAFDDKAEEAR